MLCKVFRINNEINVVEYSEKGCEKQVSANKSVLNMMSVCVLLLKLSKNTAR